MHINQAVKNNPDKFPKGYVFESTNQEIKDLLSKKLIANISPKTRFMPKAFIEKGLYMLATILKSLDAVQTTIAIIEAFTQMRQMSQSIVELMRDHNSEQKQKAVIQIGEKLFGGIIDNAMDMVGTETSFELNLAALKIKHTILDSAKRSQSNGSF
jgi:hypothetical protein